MLSTAVVWAEATGSILLLASIVWLRAAPQNRVLGMHVLAAMLSVALPAPAASRGTSRSATWPVAPVSLTWLLGFLNGVLGAIWGARAQPKFSVRPMVGLTLGGLALVVVVLFANFRLTPLF